MGAVAAPTHHNCNRTVRSSRYIVFDRKSMPMVAWGAKIRQWRSTKRGEVVQTAALTRQPIGPRDSPSRLPGLTWYVLSNLSYIKRVMMLVLPTL